MAIQFARVEYVSRSSGGNACRKAAYNERSEIKCDRTGEVFSFKAKTDLSYHEVRLPNGVSDKFKDPRFLWNSAEKAEKRKDSQVAKESVIALPDDKVITQEDRIELSRRFADQLFVSKGLAAQINIHAPHEGDKNWHAHILVTTRGFTPDGESLSAYKARETDPAIRKGYIKADLDPGKIWAQIQNAYFREKGYELVVDPTGIIAQEHIGPVRMRKHMGEALERANELIAANEEAVRNPEHILKKLTEKQSIFTKKDLEQFLSKHVDKEEIESLKNAVMGHKEVLSLYDWETGQKLEQWTTESVRSEEEKLLRFAKVVNERGHKEVKATSILLEIESSSLSTEQKRAVEFVTAATKGISIIEGRAGTGKSYTMNTIRKIYEENDLRVIGLAPTNQVTSDMKKDGFAESLTVHSFLFKCKNDRLPLKPETVLILDEAAMVGNSALVELLNVAKEHKLKLVMFGDDRQLSSVDRGGMFRDLIEKFGSQELTEVRRQHGWQKQVSELLSEGETGKAAQILQERGAIQWSKTKAESLTRLVNDWAFDSELDPSKNRLVLANKNIDVDALNKAIREIRLSRGEISSTGYNCQTARGKEIFSEQDRVCLTITDKNLGILNGTFGTIEKLNEKSCSVKLDNGKTVSFDPGAYHGLKLGYAATIYKSQGKSIPDIYALHDASINNKLNYVALTRHQESLKIYANYQQTKNLERFTYQISRSANKVSSLRFATESEFYRQQQHEQGINPSTTQTLWESLKKTARNLISDRFHRNEDFYKVPEHKVPGSSKVDKVIAEEKSKEPLGFEELKTNCLNYLKSYNKEASGKHEVIAEKASLLIMGYQNIHHVTPDFKMTQSYLSQAHYETEIKDRNIKHCKFIHFKKETGRTPTVADIPQIHEMAGRISGIESNLYREAHLSGEPIKHQKIISQARELYSTRQEREQPLVDQLITVHEGNIPLAQKAAELITAYKDRTGFLPNPTLYQQLVEIAKYAVGRESDLNNTVTSSSQVEQSVQKLRLREEISLMVHKTESTGKLPEEKDYSVIQHQASLNIQKVEQEIYLKAHREQQRAHERELSLSQGLER